MTDQDKLKSLVEAVLKKSKYSTIDMDFIRHIGEQEIIKRGSLKEAIKSTCSKLHQVGGAFLENRPDFSQWLTELKKLPEELHSPEIRQFCQEKMRAHTSTMNGFPFCPNSSSAALNVSPPYTHCWTWAADSILWRYPGCP
jgi:16S rRNA (guanine(1405)-N(7))-methyltransferase